MNTVASNSKEYRGQAREDKNGAKRGDMLPVMIFCLLALPFGAFGQSSPHAPETGCIGEAKPALVTYAGGRLTVVANGSSLSKILEQIQAKMGIVIEGNVLQDPVMGQYGPGYPRVVLKELLDPSGYKYKMVSDGTPYSVTKVALSLHSEPDAKVEPNAGPAGSRPAGTTAAVKSGNDAAPGVAVSTSVAPTPYVVSSPALGVVGAPTKAEPMVVSPDGSSYLKGSNVSVRQLQQRTAAEEKLRSERLTKESQQKEADDANK